VDDNALHELTAGYALDALEPADARAYEQHLAHCPRCQAELAAVSAAAGALAFGVAPAEPPAALRERILAAARAERTNVVPFRKRYRFEGRHSVRALAVAATATAVGLGIWNVVLHERLDRSHEALRSVVLHGAAGSVVLGAGGQGTMVMVDLAAAPAGKTYEAWVIVDGKAQPAGTFAAGGKTVVVHLRRPVPSGAIVAVTIERAGGSERPTGQPFITSSQA
jgi:anti-sigma-K factor RskA